MMDHKRKAIAGNCEPTPPHNSNNFSTDDEKSGILSSGNGDTTQLSHERSRNSFRMRLNERRQNTRYDSEEGGGGRNISRPNPTSLISSIDDVYPLNSSPNLEHSPLQATSLKAAIFLKGP